MTGPRVVVTHWVHDEVLARLADWGPVVANPSRETWPAEHLMATCTEAEALIAFMPDRIDAGFLAAAPRLRIIAAALKGYDNIDIDACRKNGVVVTIVPDLLTAPTAELAVGLALALGRNVLVGDRRVRAGGFRGWLPVLYGTGLDGTRVGILGFGRVGRAIARRLGGFDCDLAVHDPAVVSDPEVACLDVPRLLAHSQVLICAAPLTPFTRHLIDAASLARLPSGALLVNVGRGSVVDEEAVADALESGHLGGYAADVFACEDRSLTDRPASISPRLVALDTCTVFTPHLGSAVDDVRRAIAHRAVDNLLAVLQGGAAPDAI